MELARRKLRSHHPHFQGGPGAASQVLVQSAYHTGRGVPQGRTLSPYSGPASMGVTRPEDARVAIQANPGDLVKMAIPPPSHTHTHTHLKQRGVRHCCDRGHHKVCTPVPAHRKRTLPMQSLLPHKKPCLQRPARHSSGLLRSPHQPPTPPAPKRRRPKTPPPPSPSAPVPQGLEGDEAEDAVARPLFLSRHGRASTSVT